MNPRRWLLLAIAFALIATSWWLVVQAGRGLKIRSFVADGVPVRYMAPRQGASPGVVVAHGFAGSKQLMLGYGFTLARAGYATLLFDFEGHGANPGSLTGASLQEDLDKAYRALISQPEVDPTRVALVGHSMGSGAVMTAAIADPNRYAAVIAISPTRAAVTPSAPRNLLLQAGTLETRFLANAEALLAAAGGRNTDYEAGRARDLRAIPNAEHISILFRDESHRAVLDWLGQVFAEQRETDYADRRIIWYLAHLTGWLLALFAVAPLIDPHQPRASGGSVRTNLVGLLAGATVAVSLIVVLDEVVPVQGLGGLQVGGMVAVWMLVAGVVWLGVGRTVHIPTWRDLVMGWMLFGFLWIAFGLMAQDVWVQWLLNAPRLLRWPILALACLPWFLAVGGMQADQAAGRRVIWWIGQSGVMLGGFAACLVLVPSLGFLVLLMPLLPVVLGILSLTTAAIKSPWPYAVGCALFFAWMLAAVFPLA